VNVYQGLGGSAKGDGSESGQNGNVENQSAPSSSSSHGSKLLVVVGASAVGGLVAVGVAVFAAMRMRRSRPSAQPRAARTLAATLNAPHLVDAGVVMARGVASERVESEPSEDNWI
jgi:hypothetical protein